VSAPTVPRRAARLAGSITRRALLRTGAAAALAAATGALSGSCSRRRSPRDEIVFWQFYAPAQSDRPDQRLRARWFERLVAEWNANERTKVRLVYVPGVDTAKLATSFAAGSGPDIFIISPGDILRYLNGGVLMDLTPFMTRAAIDDFFPSNMETRLVGGRVYGLPFEIEPMAMFYSKAAFRRVGVSEENLPSTWEELFALGRRLRAADLGGVIFPTRPGYYQNFTWYPLLWQCGGDVVSASGRSSPFGSDAAVRALRVWQDAVRSGISPRVEPASADEVVSLSRGYASAWYVGSWKINELRDRAPRLRYGVFPMPPPAGGIPKSVLGGWAFVANARGAAPEAAARFCVWAIGSMAPDSIERVYDWCVRSKGAIAPRHSVMERIDASGGYEDPAMQVFRTQVFPVGRGEPRYPPVIYKAVSDAIQECQLAGANPRDKARVTARAIDAYLGTYRGAKIV